MPQAFRRVLFLLLLLTSLTVHFSCRPFLAGGIYHEVKPGHTLYTIARAYNKSVSEIQEANNITGTTIYSGQELFIPRALRPRYVHPTIGRRIRIEERTSLEDLASRYNMDRDYLHQANEYPFWKRSVRREEVFIPGLTGTGTTVATTPPRQRTERTVRPPEPRLPFSIIWPVEGRITSTFQSRERPNHSGLDIAAPSGTPIKAAAAGTVVYSDNRISGYGNMVILKHEGDYFTVYSHNKRNAVQPGDTVRQGDIIGYVGMTGRATGPHLHFEIRHQDTPIDPQKYLP